MIKIYYGSPSIFGRKALTVLEEKGLKYEIKPISIREGDNLKAEYLKINPNGEVPALIDEDGTIVYESTAIAEYLNEKYPDPPLMPGTPALRAQVRMIDDFCDLHLYPPVRRTAIRRLREKLPPVDEDIQEAKTALGRIKTYLGDKEFLVGSFSLADCAFMPVIPGMDFLGLNALLTSSGLEAYSNRLKARPGYKGASLITK